MTSATVKTVPMYPWTPRWNPVQRTFYFYNHLTHEITTQRPLQDRPVAFIPIISAPVTSHCIPVSVTPQKKRRREHETVAKYDASTSSNTTSSSSPRYFHYGNVIFDVVDSEVEDDDEKCRKKLHLKFSCDQEKKTEESASIGQKKWREVEHGSPFEIVVRR